MYVETPTHSMAIDTAFDLVVKGSTTTTLTFHYDIQGRLTSLTFPKDKPIQNYRELDYVAITLLKDCTRLEHELYYEWVKD